MRELQIVKKRRKAKASPIRRPSFGAANYGEVVEARGGTLVWQTQLQISLTSRS